MKHLWKDEGQEGECKGRRKEGSDGEE